MRQPLLLWIYWSVIFSSYRSMGAECDWRIAMRDVRERFAGPSGTIARFGDSIFVSQAFFVPLRDPIKNANAIDNGALTWLRNYLRPRSVWGWQSSPQTGAAGGTTSKWPLVVEQNRTERNIDFWLRTLNPEMAVIMWGTNDIFHGTPSANYVDNMREVLRTVKENGTIPILVTIPPMHNRVGESTQIGDSLRELAADECVPLIDYQQEIFNRNPGDTWNGALVDSNGQIYQVERLVAGDGIHPSNPTPYYANFHQDALNKSGYTLLNHMALHATYDVHRHVFIIQQRADLNGDGRTDVTDIDSLAHAIRVGDSRGKYDLDLDGQVNDRDQSYMVEVAFRTFVGDSNLDRVFDSGDMIQVFRAGEYEDLITNNSTWSEGDWNGDGEFESGDLIVAFKAGAYEQGPRSAAHIPEPCSAWITGLTIWAGIAARRRAAVMTA